MRKLILTLVAVSIAVASHGQKAFILSLQDKRGFVAASAGASLPVGSFARTSLADESTGKARQGMAVSLSAGYRLTDVAGLIVRAEHHRNSLNTAALADELKGNESTAWTANAGDWVMTTYMGGPYVQIPVGRLAVSGRLLAGRAQATLPALRMQAESGTAVMGFESTGSRSTALAVGGGVVLGYRLAPGLSVQMSAEYSRARFLFDGLSSAAWRNTSRSESLPYSHERIVSVVSTSVGLVFLFGDSNRPF